LSGPRELLNRPAGATPSLGELRAHHIKGGFPTDIDQALRHIPGLLQAVASRVLDAYFPLTLHADIVATLSLDLDGPTEVREATPIATADKVAERRRRDPGFRDRVLRAYEYRCCVCGFDLRIGHAPAGLEAAHIQWHHHPAQPAELLEQSRRQRRLEPPNDAHRPAASADSNVTRPQARYASPLRGRTNS